MSIRDYKRDRENLSKLVSRPAFVTLAVNSIKLHIDKNIKNGTYIWIDPPWQFGQGDQLITSSSDCPSHKVKNYENRFKSWLNYFGPVFSTTLEKAQAKSNGSIELRLAGNYRIISAPSNLMSDDEMWYDDWYIDIQKDEEGRA